MVDFDVPAAAARRLDRHAGDLAVGLLFVPMKRTMQPRMTHELATASGPLRQPSVTEAHGQLAISPPRVLGKDWGDMIPVSLVIDHAVYGLVLALIYGCIP